MNKSKFYLYFIIAVFVGGFLIISSNFSESDIILPSNPLTVSAANCEQWEVGGCFGGSGSVSCSDGSQMISAVGWCNTVSPGRGCAQYDWGWDADRDVAEIWEWGNNYGEICLAARCEKCSGNGGGGEGCDDCGSCNDSRYRWCYGGSYGSGECVDYTCECRPDLEECGGAQCGNGKIESGEECDDGNTRDGDGCSSVCKNESQGPVCGNSKVESGEQCDDGNTNSGDGCSSTCQNEGGGGGGGPTCSSPSWQGWSIDACWDENGIANCDKTSDVAEWICQNLYNQPVVNDYSAAWLGGGTIYVPTGRICPFCSFLFTNICCSPPPPTVNLSAPSIVEVPNAIVLTWSSSNTNSCSASGNWSGGKSTSGSETIKSKTTTADRGTYNFTLSCSGPGGSASDSLSVKVIQVPYCIFSADPKIIILPQLSTLTWECSYADSCEIDQGIGSVNNVSGSVDVRPSKTTTYTLDCQGLDGSRQFQADVGVGFIPVWREVLPR